MGKRKAKAEAGIFDLEEQLKTAICVPAIRQKITEWRNGNYKGITETTRELLNFWKNNDHKIGNNQPFKFHKSQIEAIESIIYIFEIEKIRTRTELLLRFASNNKDLRLPPYDEYARYCIKMATGSGKTFIMVMSVVWQFANYLRGGQNYANNFLIIAPNVIVYERLEEDFSEGKVFKKYPFIPKHLQWLWDMKYYVKNDMESSFSEGALYLTNIQQLYDRSDKKSKEEVEIMTDMLGALPPAQKTERSDFDDRIAKREGFLMVLNDEAHHTHDENNEWNNVTRALHKKRNIIAQLDFSATPRYSKGSLFAWTIFDYPLKQAIIDKIVKRPVIGIANIEEAKSDVASIRYEGFLTAAVERWKEYSETFSELKKDGKHTVRPILFIMLNETKEADEIGDWLSKRYKNYFGGEKTLIIHTNKSGEITKGDLSKARDAAKNVDSVDSKINAIVSVLMLREGWDVKNVTVVLGLRPYTAKANILPEQTIGRGLRLMFRGENNGYDEKVDIIGNSTFLEFVKDLENLEQLKFDTFELGKDKLKILIVQPMDNKKKFDIAIPDISPLLTRKSSLADEISKINVMEMKTPPLPYKMQESEEKTFKYEGRDILTDAKLFIREYSIPEPQTAEEIIGYYARIISHNIKLPSQFSVLAPKLREFFQKKAFGLEVDLNDKTVIKAMSSNVASYVVIKEFEKVLRKIIIEEKKPELILEQRYLSSTSPFPTSRKLFEAKKSVFNYTVCDNEFELSFAKFLDKSKDIKAFSKLPEQFGFCIQYTDTLANIRNYFPDFIAIDENNNNWIIETKGREDIEVKRKDIAAISWCEAATELTKKNWKYIKILQKDFEKLNPDRFEDLLILVE